MQIWQLFNILRQPVDISITVFPNPTKLTNYLFIFNTKYYFSQANLICKSCLCILCYCVDAAKQSEM